METDRIYTRCRNCSRIFDTTDTPGRIFCSPQCSIVYGYCIVCGSYFVKKDGVEDGFCSKECRDVYISGKKHQ